MMVTRRKTQLSLHNNPLTWKVGCCLLILSLSSWLSSVKNCHIIDFFDRRIRLVLLSTWCQPRWARCGYAMIIDCRPYAGWDAWLCDQQCGHAGGSWSTQSLLKYLLYQGRGTVMTETEILGRWEHAWWGSLKTIKCNSIKNYLILLAII